MYGYIYIYTYRYIHNKHLASGNIRTSSNSRTDSICAKRTDCRQT